MRLRLVVLTVAFSLLGSIGCVAVKPWERDLLASPGMSWDDDPRLATLRAHVHFSKEATFSSAGSGGGGCGCN